MSLYALVVNPVGRVAETADPAAHAVPVSTKPLRFQGRLPAEEVHARLRRCLTVMHQAERSVFLWFSEIQERRLYRELGYSSIQAYASEELDFTANRVNRYLHLIIDLERLPLIRKALHAGELGWTKARAIVKVSSPATEERWLEAAMHLSRRDLESKVTQARIQAAARRRGDAAQPDLAPRGSQPPEKISEKISEKMSSEKVPSEKTTSEPALSGGLEAQAPDYAAPQSEDPAEAPPKGTHEPQWKDTGGLQSQGTGTPQSQATAAPQGQDAGGPQSQGTDGLQSQDTGTLKSQDTDRNETPVFRPLAGSQNEPLIDDGPVSVVFRFAPLDLARYEAQIEKIRKQGGVAPGASREQILLQALDELIALGNRQSGCQEQGNSAGKAEGESTSQFEVGSVGQSTGEFVVQSASESLCAGESESGGESTGAREVESAGQSLCSGKEVESVDQSQCGAVGARVGESGLDAEASRAAVPRGTAVTPYCIVIYKCDTCQAAVVQTQRGPLGVGRAQLAAAECDAVISEPGKPNRSSIPPAVRRAVLERDRHRCQAPGCRNTRFSEVHHIVPRELGGTNHPKNLIVLCSTCHKLWHDKKLDGRLLKHILE